MIIILRTIRYIYKQDLIINSMTTNNKEDRKKWDKKYRENNGDSIKESQKKYQDSDSGKKIIKKWRDDNRGKIRKSSKEYDLKNPDKAKKRFKKYYNTDKGTVNMLRKHDKRRLGIKKSKLTLEIIQTINKRDKVCVYCGKDFNDDIEHDHINPFKPFSRYNIVRACSECNKDKSRADMIQWMNFKKYGISQKLLDLYKKAYK